ncbi:MAG: hypothetical protein ABI886_16920 [Betaproteobacteria bacterium]
MINTPSEPPDPITQNIESIAAFYQREGRKVTRSQWIVESISNIVARPIFLGCIVLFVTLWILANVAARQMGMAELDPPPFFWLGELSVCGRC